MKPWLTVIGVGADGIRGLTPRAQAKLAECDVVFGWKRILETSGIETSKQRIWPWPFHKGVDEVTALRGQKVGILATGDPMHFGIGATLEPHVPSCEVEVVPVPSAFSLAAARMGWPLQTVAQISLHGRPIERLAGVLQPNRRIIALTSDASTISEVVILLTDHGYGASQLTVLEDMGADTERVSNHIASELQEFDFSDFNTVAIECVAAADAWPLSNVPGLPDDWFKHDGQLTKRDVRAITLSALAPAHGELLWDVGAGCGSVAIEWMRAMSGARAIAFERNQQRLDMISTNAQSLGTPELDVVAGDAPESFANQPAPDAVFVGGGISNPDIMDAAWSALKPSGRLIANAVTLEGEAELQKRYKTVGGELARIDISTAEPVGALTAMRPRMAVTQWRSTKADTA